ncbi:hypothetical protein GCM10020258_51280 [Sphingomonas yabuuchiae]
MAVVAFVSPKGGVGKTTAALLLAGEIADQGGKVRIIDADPNQPLQAWSEMPGRPDNISVVSCRSENDIGDLIEEGKTRRTSFLSILKAQRLPRSPSRSVWQIS